MKIIHINYPITKNIVSGKLVLALGFFDGIHLGHQRLIEIAHEIAVKKNLPLMVLTFNKHPKEIYAHVKDFKYLTTLDEKAKLIKKMDVDYLGILEFTPAFSKITPKQFVDNVLVRLNADTVVAGFDYTFGPVDIANMPIMKKMAQGRFQVITVPKQTFDGIKISSTAVRNAITAGNMTYVSKLLGYHYQLSGKVGHGLRNGHKLGFPTINLTSYDSKILPKIGVYATKTKVDGKWYKSMTSVGYNPTISNNNHIFIESNLFNFDKDVYGKPTTIKWFKYLRGEIKFDSLDQLKKQMIVDKKHVQEYFEEKI